MEINEQEAWIILSAFNVAEMERGKCDEEEALIIRIRHAFPEINAKLVLAKETERLLRAIQTDPRMIIARKEFSDHQLKRSQYNKERKLEEWHAKTSELHKRILELYRQLEREYKNDCISRNVS